MIYVRVQTCVGKFNHFPLNEKLVPRTYNINHLEVFTLVYNNTIPHSESYLHHDF